MFYFLMILFWIHQVIFGMMSVFGIVHPQPVIDFIPTIAISLVWIGGSLALGLPTLILAVRETMTSDLEKQRKA